MRNHVFGVSDKVSHYNRAVQPKKLASGLKFRNYKVEGLNYLVKTKALTRPYFAYVKSRFAHDTAHYSLIL